VSFDVKTLSQTKSKETGLPLCDWVLALESASHSLQATNIEFKNLKYIVLASSSPAQFTTMARLIYQYAKSYPKGAQTLEMFFNYVNNSSFDLPGWIEAVTYFHDWLTSKNRKIDFYAMLGYLECCAAAPEAAEPGQTLRTIVKYMLETWDYDAG
jgi:hypothetical protein